MPAFTRLPSPTHPSAPHLAERRRLLGSLAATWVVPSFLRAAPVRATNTAASERRDTPLILAQEAPDHIDPHGWLVSEKYDGVRARWDGHVLRFRSGLTIAAPASFLNALPPVPLDGELWLGRGRFDELSGIVRRQEPEEAAWQAVQYLVFEMPGAGGRFRERAQQLRRWLQAADTVIAAKNDSADLQEMSPLTVSEAIRLERLKGSDEHPVAGGVANSKALAVTQWVCADRLALRAALDRVVHAGGEGVMLHRADAPEIHGRSGMLLKLKPLHDDEAVVVGHEPGRGRLAGRLGALRVRDDNGRHFEVGTGLDDAQRSSPPAIGTRITFTHRGRTPSGVPRFATFLRVREV